LKGMPLDVVRSVAKSSGIEAYKLLVDEHESTSRNRTLAVLQGIVAPTFLKKLLLADVFEEGEP
jgi:hypothetical protein